MYPAPRIVRVGTRDLAIEDAGPEAGFPVVVYNGAGSRHVFPRAVAGGRELGFRLIGYDRPGCGRSTPIPGRVVADCAADVQAIMSELGLAKVAVWDSSGGARTRWRRRPG
jgi:pimeloyl-ACP methyl ester carboxylesterase